MFGKGGQYNGLEWGFLVGLLLPIPFWYLSRKYPNSLIRYIHIPAMLYGSLNLAPYNLSYQWPCLMASWFFNYYMKRRNINWWQKYAYVLTSSFATAIALSAVVIFFSVQYVPKNINWWGNTVSYAGVDGGGSTVASCALRSVPSSGTFTH